MDFFSLAKFIPILSEAFNSNKYYKPAQQAANAQLDPNSPMFQRLYGAEKQSGQDNLAFQIAELQRQNRKETQLGRTPLFNAERGGETVFRGLTQGNLQAADQARRTTYDALGAGSKNLAELGKQKQLSGLYKAYGLGSIADAFKPEPQQAAYDTMTGKPLYDQYSGKTIAQMYQPQSQDFVSQLKGLFGLG